MSNANTNTNTETAISSIIEDIESSTKFTEQISAGLKALDALLQLLVPCIADDKDCRLQHFKTLQDNFEYNLTSLLLNAYKSLEDSPAPDKEASLLLCNRLLQGLLLIHPPSRKLFSRKDNMNLILHFIQTPTNRSSIAVQISFISTLIHILLKNLNNFRTFESCHGCSIVIEKLNLLALTEPEAATPDSASTTHTKKKDQQVLNFKLIEFLIFYLVDENEVNFDYNVEPKLSVSAKTDLFRDLFPEIDSLVENLNDLKNL